MALTVGAGQVLSCDGPQAGPLVAPQSDSQDGRSTAKRTTAAIRFTRPDGDPWTATRKDNGRISGRGATLETRDAKHEPRSLAEQRVIWHAQAAETLGGPHAVQNMITHALNPSCTPSRVVDAGWVTATAKRVLAAVEERRSTWQSWHVRAEALRNVRSAEIERQS